MTKSISQSDNRHAMIHKVRMYKQMTIWINAKDKHLSDNDYGTLH